MPCGAQGISLRPALWHRPVAISRGVAHSALRPARSDCAALGRKNPSSCAGSRTQRATCWAGSCLLNGSDRRRFTWCTLSEQCQECLLRSELQSPADQPVMSPPLFRLRNIGAQRTSLQQAPGSTPRKMLWKPACSCAPAESDKHELGSRGSERKSRINVESIRSDSNQGNVLRLSENAEQWSEHPDRQTLRHRNLNRGASWEPVGSHAP